MFLKFNRSRSLNHREVDEYFHEFGSEYKDIVYFSRLSREAILKEFQILLPEIKQFMKKKEQNDNFRK